MNQDHRHVLAAKALKIARAAADQVIDFAGGLNAAKTAAHHDESQIPPAPLGIGADFRAFHLLHDM